MIQKLKKLYIFEWMDEDFLKQLLKISKIENYKANEIILKEWDTTQNWYILINGIVSVIKGEKIINTIFEWDIFWEIGLVLNEPRTATIKSETDIQVLVISKNWLDKFFDGYTNWEFIKVTLLNRIIQNHNKK